MKKSISITMLVIMILSTMLFGGCSKSGNDKKEASKQDAKVEDTKKKDTKEVAKDTKEAPAELLWYQFGDEPKGLAEVQAEFDKMTLEKFNAKVKLSFIAGGDFDKKLPVIINSGEKYDLTFTCSWANDFQSNASKGAYAPLDEYLKETPKLKEFIPSYLWDAATVNGKIYAMPVFKDVCAQRYLVLAKELIGKYGCKVEDFDTFESLEKILPKIKENEPNVVPIGLTQDGWYCFYDYDFPVNHKVPMAIRYDSKDAEVVNVFEQDDIKDYIKTIRKYFQAGYINPDAPTVTETIKNSFASCMQGFPYADSIWTKEKGFEVISIPVGKALTSTGSARGSMHAVSSSSDHPDIATKVLELVNTDPAARNLIAFGIEGRDYKKISDNVIELVEDTYTAYAFATGTFFKSLYVTSPDPADKWEKIYDWVMNDSVPSPAIGFAFDQSPVANEIAAVKNVSAKYYPMILTGAGDPDEFIPQMLDEMKKAGFDKVVEECQNQINEWKKSK